MKTGKRAILAVVVVLCFCGSIFAGVTIYVDVDVNGTGTGLSWENAYNYLQDALAVALSGDQIRVAQGSYTPDSNSAVPDGSDDPEAIFQLINGVTIKGGYAGCGEPYPYARDIELYETILTGDLSGDDGEFSYSDPNRRENSYHVVTGSGTDITAVMDGLTIADGRHWIVDYHNDDYYYSGAAGGMYNLYGSPTIKSCKFTCNIAVHAAAMYNYYSDPVIIDCNFISNVARENAGGIYNSKSNPVIMNCVFDNNRAFYSDGGGVYNRSSSSPKISGCIFKNNDAEYGGGICNDYSSSPIVSDCIFANNQGDEYGGGMYNDSNSSPTLTDCIFTDNDAEYGGGMYNDSDSSPILTNCIFSNNEADERGAGMYNIDSSSPILTNCLFTGGLSEGQGTGMCNIDSSNPILINCTFTANSSDYPYGATIYNNQSSPIITNSILWGNVDEIYSVGGTPIVTYSDVQGGWEGVGNIDIDPLFADANGPDGIVGSEDDNLRLSAGSLCINAGDNSAVTVAGDINGNTRIIDGTVDMGAYESNMIYVDADAVGAETGLSWANAYCYLQDALDVAESGAEIMVAQGSYTPDSNSALPDGSGDRRATFRLISGVAIKGGYAGGGETDPDARDIEVYETILSGDLNGDDGPDFVNNGENSYHVVTSSGVDETAVFDGFTITAGNGSEGGGMYHEYGNPTLLNCTFSGNSASNCGGALYSGSHLTLSSCTFSGNKAVYGGAIYNYYSYPVMTNCIFIGNTAQNGGAMYSRDCSYSILNNCIFVSNSAEINGGGIYEYDCCFGSSTLTNCIFWGNSDANGMDSSSQIYNRCNTKVSYSCIQGGYPGVGNIQVDPQFVDFGNGDYHLKSEGWRWCEGLLDWQYDDVTSRCIDSGNPGSLLGEELLTIPSDPNHERGENIRINMGVFGGTVEASMAPSGWALLGDLSNDGTVDYVDLAGQVEDWLMNDNAQPGDLNRDGVVDMADFVLLAQDWSVPADWAFYPSSPNPGDGSTGVALYGTVLRWSAGKKTVYQDVYFGQSEDAVRDANSSSPEYKGQIDVDTFDPGSFELMKTYYWRVDQLDGSSELIVKGPVWRFSSNECVTVEDFESYDDEGNSIGDVWVDKLRYGEMQITIQNDPVISPVNSMRLRYHTAYIPYYNLAVRSFSPAQDWTALGVEVLTIHCYGTADNFDLPMFVTIGDGTTDANVVVTDVNTTVESWQEINVSLSEIAAAGVDLNSVSYMEIGFGDGTDLGMHGSKWDIIYIDDIALYRPE